MDSHDRLLSAFLAGDLDPAQARHWDEHLLECERCWRAVREDRAGREAAQALRQPAPPGLADRVAFAVEVAAPAGSVVDRRSRPPSRVRRPDHRAARRQWLLAGAAMLGAAAAVAFSVLLQPGGHRAGTVPAAVAAVARYAQAIPVPARDRRSFPDGRPVQVGNPLTVTAGGQRITLRTWRLGGTEAVVAVSDKPFPMPPRAEAIASLGMAWSARLGRLGLYCVNGKTSELVAAPVPAVELAALAALLPPA